MLRGLLWDCFRSNNLLRRDDQWQKVSMGMPFIKTLSPINRAFVTLVMVFPAAIACGAMLIGCASVGKSSFTDGTHIRGEGMKGKAYLLQAPKHLLKRGFQDGKIALVNIIDLSGTFGISPIKYGIVALAHPAGSLIPNPDVDVHLHASDFKPRLLGEMPFDHSGWPHYLRIQNFSPDRDKLLDVMVACERKGDPKGKFGDVKEMASASTNPYTCNLNPHEVYGVLWGTKIIEYGILVGDADIGTELQRLEKLTTAYNATVTDQLRVQVEGKLSNLFAAGARMLAMTKSQR